MSSILVLNSSVYGDASATRQLVAETVAKLKAASPGVTVVERDLGSDPIPHLTTANLAGIRGTPTTPEELEARALSDRLIAELKAADTLVIGSPMYNFSISTGLRAWFDWVLRAGETFRYTQDGPQGLVGSKRVIILEARGGLYSEGPTASFDYQEPYLRHLLWFIGLTDVTFVHAEKLGYGPEVRESAIHHALARIADVVARPAAELA